MNREPFIAPVPPWNPYPQSRGAEAAPTHSDAGKRGGRPKKAKPVTKDTPDGVERYKAAEHTKGLYGTDPAYLAARIARDAPEVHEAMKAGKYPSVRAAAKAAPVETEKNQEVTSNNQAQHAAPEKRRGAAALRLADHLGLVHVLARRFVAGRTHLAFDDLLQEGALGLHRAIETHDAARGPFGPHAARWISSFIARAVDREREVRVPFEPALRRVRRVRGVIEAREGRAATVAEMATATEMAPRKVARILGHERAHVVSLDAERDGDEGGVGSLHDVLAADPGEPIDDALDRLEHDRRVREVVEMLPAREREILLRRAEGETLRDIAETLGVCSERVRQIATKALQVVRAELRRRGIGA